MVAKQSPKSDKNHKPMRALDVTDIESKSNTGMVRKPYTFTLSDSVNEAINKSAHRHGLSRSGAIERMFTIDEYSDLFRRFKEGQSFVDIVIETCVSPQCVRMAKDEYDHGFERPPIVEDQVVDKKIQAREKQLEIREAEIKSKERIEMEKIAAKKELADKKAQIEADRIAAKREQAETRSKLDDKNAEARARLKRLDALNTPYVPVPRPSMFAR
jgi:hypothetical protein